MSVIEELLASVPMPQIVRIRQHFVTPRVDVIPPAVQSAFAHEGDRVIWPKSGEIAVVVGSRGVNRIVEITRAVCNHIKEQGLKPFVVPGMGSHGGATAAGQAGVLAALGVTEETIGAPIRSSMEVIQVGELRNGLPVYMDRLASEAAGIVVINRVKPHTAFHGTYESGIVKMIAIGLGKQKGAQACHKLGFGHMEDHIVQAAKVILATNKVVCGVAALENAHDEVAEIEVLPATEIFSREPALLNQAKKYMPRILVNDIDVLVVDEIGKDISGDGMDPNITGRYSTPFASGGPRIARIAVLRLTEKSHGNANGLGLADTTTKHVMHSVDFSVTYPNALTSTVIEPVKLPMVLETDGLAIAAAIKTANLLRDEDVRVVHIRNTLRLDDIYVSTSLLPELAGRDDVTVLGEPILWPFSDNGDLDTSRFWHS